MRIMRRAKLTIVAVLFCALCAEARIAFVLKSTPIALGYYDPTDSALARLSPDGSLFGQIDSLGNARIWALDNPSFPMLELFGDAPRGKIYININFSFDNKYIIFDGTTKNTGLATKGEIVVLSTDNFIQQKFSSYLYGGTSRSRFAFSHTGTLAYVPAENAHQINIIDLRTKNSKTILDGFCPISAVAIDPTAQKIAIKDVCAQAIRIRDIKTGTLLKRLDLDAPMPDDPFSPDQSVFYWGQGSMLAVNSDANTNACALDAHTGKGQFPFMWFSPLAMFQSNDTNTLAIADITWSLNIQKINDPMLYIIQPFGFNNFVLSGAFSPDNKRFALGSSEGQVAVYDANLNYQCSGALSEDFQILQIVFVNQERFISVSSDNNLTRWDISK